MRAVGGALLLCIFLCLHGGAAAQTPSYEQDLYGKPSLAFRASAKIIRAYFKRPGKLEKEKAEAQAGSYNKNRTHWIPKDGKFRGCEVRRDTIGGVPVVFFQPKRAEAQHVLLYFHGGGYSDGPFLLQGVMLAELAKRTGSLACMVDYRLAPEQPFPAGLNDCMTVYKNLAHERGGQAIDLIGDSAGGGMCMAVTQEAAHLGVDRPRRLLLISPWLLLGSSNPMMDSLDAYDPMLKASGSRQSGLSYAGETSVEDPLVSPYYADLEDFPPMLLLIGTHDILYADAAEFIARAKGEGRPLHAVVAEEMVHVWPIFYGFFPEAERAIGQIADYILAEAP